jgi:hypothetical protein|tara:strand:- start:317 stop:643 length:327 start_codon:yes stop_codon:yes gene_type:complete
MKNTLMKNFIYENIGAIKNLNPIATVKNEFGVEISFYFIGSSELKHLINYVKENTEYKNCIEEKKLDFLKWFINRWTIAIINSSYRLNQFMKKDDFEKLKTYTKITVV